MPDSFQGSRDARGPRILRISCWSIYWSSFTKWPPLPEEEEEEEEVINAPARGKYLFADASTASSTSSKRRVGARRKSISLSSKSFSYSVPPLPGFFHPCFPFWFGFPEPFPRILPLPLHCQCQIHSWSDLQHLQHLEESWSISRILVNLECPEHLGV